MRPRSYCRGIRNIKNYVNVNANVSVGTTLCDKEKYNVMLLFCRVRFCLSQCIDIEICCNINQLYYKRNFDMFPN